MRPTSALLALLLAATPLAAQPGATATPEARLAALGHTLPPVNRPSANFVPAVRTGSLVFVSGHVSRGADGKLITGKVPRDLSAADAHAAARHTALALLATLKAEIGDLAKVKRIVRVGGFVNAVPEFTGHPQVMNGCSDLLVAVFGDKGRHARAALGMGSLPSNAAVEIDLIVEVE